MATGITQVLIWALEWVGADGLVPMVDGVMILSGVVMVDGVVMADGLVDMEDLVDGAMILSGVVMVDGADGED